MKIGTMLKKIFELKEGIKILEGQVKTKIEEAKSAIVSGGEVDDKGNFVIEDSGYKGLVVKSIELNQEEAVNFIKNHYPERKDDLIKVVEKTSVELLSKVMSKEEIESCDFSNEILSLRVKKEDNE